MMSHESDELKGEMDANGVDGVFERSFPRKCSLVSTACIIYSSQDERGGWAALFPLGFLVASGLDFLFSFLFLSRFLFVYIR